MPRQSVSKDERLPRFSAALRDGRVVPFDKLRVNSAHHERPPQGERIYISAVDFAVNALFRTVPQIGYDSGVALLLDMACDAAIRAHGAADYPHECCGALLGRREDGPGDRSGRDQTHVIRTVVTRTVVTRTVRMKNLNTERARDRFTLDPLELMQVEKAADRDGLELVGIYHSHPDHPAEPSLTDLSFAEPWPGLVWIILSVRQGRPADLKGWMVAEAAKSFTEEPVTVVGGATFGGTAFSTGGGARP